MHYLQLDCNFEKLLFDLSIFNLNFFSRQLLLDCGIGCDTVGCNTEPVVNQHRALVFCQLKAMLDIVENDLFK